jgi:transposase
MELFMEQFVGLDVSQKLTHVCVVDQKGSVIWRGTCLSTPEDIAATVRAKAPEAVRIGLETGPLSTWHWHALKAMGLPVICIDARHAKAALSMQINKTDRNDAAGLAQIMRTGWYREVGVKSLDNHQIRAVLGARAQLVGMQTDLKNQIRGLLKVFGTVLQRGHSQSFEQQVIAASQGNELLDASVRGLLAALKTVGEQVAKLDRLVIKQAKENAMCRHLMSIPGVGVLTALAFMTAIEDPARFQKSRSVGAFLGLTPKRHQSGETDWDGRISKRGDALVRAYLYEAANALLTNCRKWSALKAWGMQLAKRRGLAKAKVAVARKLAVIMHQMWTTGEAFRWSSEAATGKPTAA